MRAALYARYSTDQQRDASIADQLRLARRHAQRLGHQVVAEYSDARLSGQALANREGILALLHHARAGGFDVVICEHTNRLARDGGHVWDVYYELKALGIPIETVNEGRAGALQVGVSGMLSALMLEDLGAKTRRGLEGVVISGRAGGGLCYGYRKRLQLDARNEPIRGLRDIAPEEAEVVRRIFREYAAGSSPLAICAGLNADGVPGPRGGIWSVTTIQGNARRGNGVLHNELYRGVIAWGRSAYVKDRNTGRRRARAGVSAEITRREVPELRIVDEPLWLAVRARYAQVSRAAAGGRPVGARRPVRLLSGLISCGCCGGPMAIAGRNALRCSTRVRHGPETCSNTKAPGYNGIEARVLQAIKGNLLHPDVVEAAVRELQATSAERGRADRHRRLKLEKELGEVVRKAHRLVDQVASGALEGPAVREALNALEARRAELEAQLKAAPAEVVEIHRGAATAFRRLVEVLEVGLAEPACSHDAAARDALRSLITTVRISPLPVFGQVSIEIVGNLAPLLGFTEKGRCTAKVGAGTRVTLSGTLEPIDIRLSA